MTDKPRKPDDPEQPGKQDPPEGAGSQHWPFGAGPEEERKHDLERERVRRDQAAEARRKMRFDRFIVGGRAHTRKRGLS